MSLTRPSFRLIGIPIPMPLNVSIASNSTHLSYNNAASTDLGHCCRFAVIIPESITVRMSGNDYSLLQNPINQKNQRGY
jgi:hypothetical protein